VCGRGGSFGSCRSHGDPPRSPFGDDCGIGSQEPDRAETPCLPPTFGSGDAEAVRAARRNVQQQRWAARNARQHRERVDPKPKGASSGRAAATSRASQRTPRRKKALRSESSAAHRGDTAADAARNGGRAHQSVNAIASERTRRGDDMVRLPRRGTLRRVFATGDDFWMDREVHDLRVGARSRDRAGSPKRGEPHGRLRGATNPRTVERADLRIRSLRRNR
jgi:hypothetical protein